MEQAFTDYVSRMAEIRRLSLPEIRDTDSAEEYRNRLCQSFDKIGRLAGLNRSFLTETLYPLLRSNDDLSLEMEDQLQTLCEQLFFVGGKIQDENLDLPVMSLIIQRLISDAKHKGENERLFELNKLELFADYGMMDITRRIFTQPDMASDYAHRGAEAVMFSRQWAKPDHFATIKESRDRNTVLNNLRFGAYFMTFEKGDFESSNVAHLDALDRVTALVSKSMYRDEAPDMDWRYYWFRLYEYYQELTDLGNARGFSKAQLEHIADVADSFEALVASDRDYYSKLMGYNNVAFRCARNRYLAGRLSEDAYMQALLAAYEMRDATDYSTDGGICNVLIPVEILCLLRDKERSVDENKLITRLYVNVLRFMFNLPNAGALSIVMNYFSFLLLNYIEVPGGVSFEAFCVQTLAALHPPTYIHSRMVGRIAECLCRHLIECEPDRFLGILGCASVEEVVSRRNEILRFVQHASSCHDYGKIPIIDTIFMYGRALLDTEFDIIRAHADIGHYLLAQVPSTRAYADVARGHHRFYNDKGGYPADFNTASSPLKTIIDVVCCADCMDAATDTVGRSYNRGKTLDVLIGELVADSGTRYAPYVVELIQRPDVRRDLEGLLSDGREQVYEETFTLLKRLREA